VLKTRTTTAVTSSASPSGVGQSVIFTATVNVQGPGGGTPTGTVQFQIDGSNAGSPVNVSTTGGITTATFSTAALTAGTHTITATYNGNGDFSASTSAAINQTVSTGSQAFVFKLYQDLLFRQPEPGGLAYWSGLLNQGVLTRIQVALGIQTSPEGRILEVEDV